MSRNVLLTSSNLRLDSRRPLEVRPITCTLDVLKGLEIDGSASVEQGLTRVSVSVCGPREPRAARGAGNARQDRVVINVEIQTATFSGVDRRKRGRNDRRTVEMASSIKNTFEPVIMGQLYPRAQIDIYVIILQQDGGTLSAAINATSLALSHAGIAMISPIASISVACLHDTPLLDPCGQEESELPFLTVACLATRPIEMLDGEARDDAMEGDEEDRLGKLTLVTLESRLSTDRFEGMMRLGQQACVVIGQELERVTRAWAEPLSARIRSRGLGAGSKLAVQSEAMETNA
ncbi:uncharacterized protein L969DRAFT_92075 [Mixia osmundae IAM 14324]|uniref:Ribosomal RNA-processing protein 41 n=1 Tax=Mixia osmundae (strain CBS 9802 / IAM 14324 / JCM 22182 / KY 12970) TaxID=764103 RepID=G7DX86_MIXOS|nr:uncharacterized protein L969DRAFT_92075 [Mixia osmundae IAM 14324]KEI42641.1 hypothetical protein L969DRAFT_92075 [Mixia osmundae IAM 14324]GAA95196.1 hypothetical protein E5Q_01851 [Mixia osmundae IAM 14324]